MGISEWSQPERRRYHAEKPLRIAVRRMPLYTVLTVAVRRSSERLVVNREVIAEPSFLEGESSPHLRSVFQRSDPSIGLHYLTEACLLRDENCVVQFLS
jgi:hypothetical protein